MANDNLSGMVLAVELAKYLMRNPRRLSYRFLFLPGTIGSITWLARNDRAAIRHGLVLSCLGDNGPFTFKKTRSGAATIDRAAQQTLRSLGVKYSVRDFTPYGYDERQYNSPGIGLAVGCLMRTPHGEYPEYHTSDDNLGFISETSLAQSFRVVSEILDVLDQNACYVNLKPNCEPCLGRYGVYSSVPSENLAMLWVLNLSDGSTDLLRITEKSGVPFRDVRAAADRLLSKGLLQVCNGSQWSES